MEQLNSKKINILKQTPCNVLIQYTQTGKIVKLPKQYFRKRLNMGFFEVENSKMIASAI